ncbi:hypothetical protein OC842_004845 [Tilletia horrida]|uniref:Chromosome transmission fidelity protein 8 n=1 Tax=Tilletia horrida TaxID=155126 RepID=A0AAN6GBG1_9BASI|nr:hypothetical protein OC842_004845 [Tilletia horrida]
MRIDVRLPLPGAQSVSADAAPAGITCPPIAKLASTGELVMIELQGALEFEGLDAGASQLIGTLTFEGPQLSRPILLVSHHRLYGKFVDLHQPLAILQKHQREPPAGFDTSSPSAKRRWLEQPWTSDVESGGEGDDGEGEEEWEGQLGLRRKRARREGAQPESSPPPPPGSSPCRSSARRARATVAPSTPPNLAASATTMVQESGKVTEGEDDEFDDADDDDSDGDGADAAETSRENGATKKRKAPVGRTPRVWYDVVCVIRRKILFSQRPEPVVKLAPEQGTETAATVSALGSLVKAA